MGNILLDVFENFRKISLETYGLDPIHYYCLPGLSWDAMLKYTGVELESITDPDMHLMLKKSMRGGVSNICHRPLIIPAMAYLTGSSWSPSKSVLKFRSVICI